jgi:hypothetical protein
MASTFVNAIIGTTQSKYAAIAIIIALLILCITTFLIESNVSIAKRFLTIFFIILLAIPGILLSLLELTCIVTGGKINSKNWWCSVLAWVITIMIIIYCIIIVIASINSIMTYGDAKKKITEYNELKKIDPEEANDFANTVLLNTDPNVNNVTNYSNMNNEEIENLSRRQGGGVPDLSQYIQETDMYTNGNIGNSKVGIEKFRSPQIKKMKLNM